MAAKVYTDFDLLIERVGDKYRARVLNSPAGPAVNEFTLPFSDDKLENFILRISQGRRRVRHLKPVEVDASREFGGALFGALFAGDVEICLRNSIMSLDPNTQSLRLRLRLSDAPELVDIPWEYLYDSANRRFLALSVDTPLVRYLDLPGRINPLTVKPPLNVLVMISSPTDVVQLDVEVEWRKLKGALADLEQQGLLRLDRLEKATLEELQQCLRRTDYHIFHFIGHGGFDLHSSDGILMLEDEQGRGQAVSGQMLGTLLHDEKTLRLALLNACEGGRTSKTDPFAGVGQSLLQQGVPAVIAMQFEVTDETAITLAHSFYSALADGYAVDAALTEARKTIFARNALEWGTPVLYMRAPDGKIFDIASLGPADKIQNQVAALLATAQAAMSNQEWAKAADLWQQVLTLEPTNNPAASGLVTARQGMNAQKPATPAPAAPVAPPAQRPSPLKLVLGISGVLIALLLGLLLMRIVTRPEPTSPVAPVETATAAPEPTSTSTTQPTQTSTEVTNLPTTRVPLTNPENRVPSFAGVWDTNFATMTLEQDGAKVTGEYQWYGNDAGILRIDGNAEGDLLNAQATYQATPSAQPKAIASLRFTLSPDQTSFIGAVYSLVSGRRSGDWCGVRQDSGQPLPPDCGFSGTWLTCCDEKGQPMSVTLTQKGDTVTGVFNTIGQISGVIGRNGKRWNDGDNYRLFGSYDDGEGNTGQLRFYLLDKDSLQFHGCWQGQGDPHPWNGWRENRSTQPIGQTICP